MIDVSLDLTTLADGYDGGGLSVTTVMEAVLARIEDAGDDHVWIYRCPTAEVMGQAVFLDALTREQAAALPLFGIPFAVKDNIDVAGCRRRRAALISLTCRTYVPRGPEPAGCRRHPDRKDQPGPVRHRPRRCSLALRSSPQSVRRALYSRRIKLGLGGRGVLRAGQLRARHRYGGLRSRPGRLQQHRRA